MKKLFKLIIISGLISITGLFVANTVKADIPDEYQKVRKGTFISVQPLEEYSTLTADAEDEVRFINMQDMYIYETKAIPEGSIFYGEIEEVREPVQGRDGSLKISINKLITADKKIYKVKGHIYSENDNYIGGKATESIYFHKVPHYSSQFRKPFLQARPLNVYETGQHTIIKPGDRMFVITEEDIPLK